MLKLKLISLRGVILERQIYSVSVKTPEGIAAIYSGHSPIISTIVPSELKVRFDDKVKDGDEEYYALAGGILNVDGENVTIIVDEASHTDDLSETEVAAALASAKQAKAEAKDQQSISAALAEIDRHEVRLSLAQKRRKQPRK
jgi:F-type H+-transporting ATPase subunit epsilon